MTTADLPHCHPPSNQRPVSGYGLNRIFGTGRLKPADLRCKPRPFLVHTNRQNQNFRHQATELTPASANNCCTSCLNLSKSAPRAAPRTMSTASQLRSLLHAGRMSLRTISRSRRFNRLRAFAFFETFLPMEKPMRNGKARFRVHVHTAPAAPSRTMVIGTDARIFAFRKTAGAEAWIRTLVGFGDDQPVASLETPPLHTLRPSVVCIRLRKPCVFNRCRTLG